MRGNRGFSLIELTVAGTMSLIVIGGGFLTLTTLQRTAARQSEVNELVSTARTAMEIMARDIRSAGTSLDLLPNFCIAAAHPFATNQCPAILDPHPWQVTIARNAWRAADGTGSSLGWIDDLPPPNTRRFDEEPENVVVYRFVPTGEEKTYKDARGRQRQGVLGRIERVMNPFEFVKWPGTTPQPAQVNVLLEDVLLDDQMRHGPDPSDDSQIDHRYDFALFMYQVLTQSGKFQGSLSNRATGLNGTFLTPPLRFFEPGDPGAFVKVSPYQPNRAPDIVGLEPDDTAFDELLVTGSDGMLADKPSSDLRRVLDRDWIRTVRIAFKVVGPERVDVRDGLDLDGNPKTGTARVYAFETTVEIKPLAQFTEP